MTPENEHVYEKGDRKTNRFLWKMYGLFLLVGVVFGTLGHLPMAGGSFLLAFFFLVLLVVERNRSKQTEGE